MQFAGPIRTMQQFFTEGQCQELLRVRDFNNSACHNFIDADRRHKTSESGTKDVLTHGIAGSTNFMFAWFLPCPQISWETNLPPTLEGDMISVFQRICCSNILEKMFKHELKKPKISMENLSQQMKELVKCRAILYFWMGGCIVVRCQFIMKKSVLLTKLYQQDWLARTSA